MIRSDMPERLAPIPSFVVTRALEIALEEDVGRGDLTTDACVPYDLEGMAVLRARREMVLSGIDVFATALKMVDAATRVSVLSLDGSHLLAGHDAARVEGRATSLLKAERVALNFVQRMSGVATMTKRFVDALPRGSKTRITDTRKTTPGLRAFERYAVRCGGGYNHREDLGSAVLIKDNHIAAAGGVKIAIERAREHAPHTCRIECEVDSLEQLEVALAARADIILLDNFDDAMVVEGVRIAKKRALLEVSGGITLERISKLGALGVDYISVGALTHSAPAADLGLDWI